MWPYGAGTATPLGGALPELSASITDAHISCVWPELGGPAPPIPGGPRDPMKMGVASDVINCSADGRGGVRVRLGDRIGRGRGKGGEGSGGDY